MIRLFSEFFRSERRITMDRNITISQAYKTMYRDYPEVVGVKDISPKRVRQLVQENKLPCIPDNRTIKVAKLFVIDYILQGAQI